MTCDPRIIDPRPIPLPAGFPPTLVVVVDTEEAFDWHNPASDQPLRFPGAGAFARFHEILEPFGVVPAYLLSYPVVDRDEGLAGLKALLQARRCVVGAHLHPWVTPPFHPQWDRQHSYPGGLPRELEQAKLATLTRHIHQRLAITPVIYKAGRYGFGPNTADILQQLGYLVDLSPAPPFDFRHDGGPDYRHFSPHPYWFGKKNNDILGLPVAGGFVGLLRQQGPWLYGWSRRRPAAWLHAGGLLARSGLLERVRLSPEGHTLDELLRLIRRLLKDGVRIFQLAFHSPSLEPGLIHYAPDLAARDHMLQTLAGVLRFFLSSLGGRTTTPEGLRAMVVPAMAGTEG